MSEGTETLEALALVTFRRLGMNRVHAALVMPETRRAASVFGAPCTAIDSPVRAFCGRLLRGQLVEIPDDKLDSWKRNGHMCRECRLVAIAALREPNSQSVPRP